MSETKLAPALGSRLCPKCKGVSEHPEVEGCNGCFECDFAGTLAGYRNMRRLMREAHEAEAEMRKEHAEYIKRGVCSQCGACNRDEAAEKCRASCGITGEYSCAGDDLWPEDENNEFRGARRETPDAER